MPNNVDQQFESDSKKIEVMLWGATGSGKTTLWRAFWRQLSLIKADLQKKKFDISLDITDRKGKPLAQDNLKFDPTNTLDYDLIIYKRNSTSQNDFNKCVNTHAHWMGVLDHKGIYTLEAVGNHTLSNDAALIRKNLLEKAKCILVILNKGSGTSPDDFYKHLTNLKDLLLQREEKCYIAACVTKLDALGEDGVGDLDPDDLLVMHFGDNVGEKILGVLKELRAKHELYLCAVSATGTYMDKDNKKKANIDEATKVIIDETNWRPENVEKPFFWLFAQVEKDRLAAPLQNGIFYKAFSKDFSKARLEQYVEYKDLLRSINW